MPILEWNNTDVERFISERGIKCHPLYYDDNGKFHVERRLGCIGCPMKSDKTADFLKYPKMLKQLIKNAQIFIDTHPNCKSRAKFGNAYNLALHDIFYDSYEDYDNAVSGGMFPQMAVDAKSALENYFKIEL